MKKKAIEEIKMGDCIVLEKNTRIRLARADRDRSLAGFAARDIEKGEIIEYSPFSNTRDIWLMGTGFFKSEEAGPK